MSKNITIKAPISGITVPLEQIPDSVFAEKMVGDGISIDPTTSNLLAPCDGEICVLHQSLHAITVKTKDNIEVMIHIGIDTVNLKGQGFKAKVKVGDMVKTGDPLIDFDMDFVAINALSLLTQIIIMNKDINLKLNHGFAKAGTDDIISFSFDKTELPENDTTKTTYQPIISNTLLVTLKEGLHARPAALLTDLAQKFQSKLELLCRDKKGNLKSTTSLLKMEIQSGDSILIRGTGADADEAMDQLIKKLNNEICSPMIKSKAEDLSDNNNLGKDTEDNNKFIGIGICPGLAISPIYIIKDENLEIEEYGSKNPEEEQIVLNACLIKAKESLKKLLESSFLSEPDIFKAHLSLLDDQEILEAAEKEIKRGKSAAYAWQSAFQTEAEALSKLNNPIMASRASDVKDIGKRALKYILGTEEDSYSIQKNSIILADELTPSQMADLQQYKINGICSVNNTASSHMAILAKSLDIPVIVGINEKILKIKSQTLGAIDGSKGLIILNPNDEYKEKFKNKINTYQEQNKNNKSKCHEKAITSDGIEIKVMGNIGNLDETKKVEENGGEGIGLIRTEFLFKNKNRAPLEDEQNTIYSKILKDIKPEYPVTFRTLDIGGDKPLPYLPMVYEQNPFLGERGIRVSLNQPELFLSQIKALLRLSLKRPVKIMLPMITTLDEIIKVREIITEHQNSQGTGSLSLGIMVEVPSVALMSDSFAQVVDFFSIGSNDLTQYTLAIDRNHKKLGNQLDPLNPAVLRLIDQTCKNAKQYNKPVSICGEIASDPIALPILIGLGLSNLSMHFSFIPMIKSQIRSLDMAKCKEIAQAALTKDSANSVRDLVNSSFNNLSVH